MNVNPSRDGSWEMVAHNTRVPNFLFDRRRDEIDRSLRTTIATEN